MSNDETDGDDDSLKMECQAAAWRASRIHSWLEPLLKDSAAAKRAYTFKGRVKSADDLHKKVLGRRNHEDANRRNRNYEPKSVTDASGFRIVKLFNAEVPQSLDELLSLLKLKLNEEVGHASQNGKLNRVIEIEFHSSRRPDDPLSIFADVQAAVKKHGFTLKPPAQDAASSYSSVHVIVECEVKDNTDPVVGCAEIQLRSVFEEAWSEISHRLKYAPIKIARATGPTPNSDQLSTSWLHLDALKSLTDGCAQYADLINRQIQISTPADRTTIQPLDAGDRSVKMFAGYGPEMVAAVKRAYEKRSEAVELKETVSRAASFRDAADLFQAAMSLFKTERNEEDMRLFDVLLEEFAFCRMFSGNEELRSRSEATYRELLTRRPERVSVLLRLGQLRRDAGDFDEAKKLMEEGLRTAKSNPDEDEEVNRQANWLLRRDLAYILWRSVDLEPQRPDAVTLLRRAIDLSQEGLTYVRTEEQFTNARQNYLYYVVELWKRAPADQREPLAAIGKKLLDELRPKVDLKNGTVENLDTIVRGENAFGDAKRALAAAKVVAQKLGERIAKNMRERNCGEGAAFAMLSQDEHTMYVYAQQLLLAAS